MQKNVVWFKPANVKKVYRRVKCLRHTKRNSCMTACCWISFRTLRTCLCPDEGHVRSVVCYFLCLVRRTQLVRAHGLRFIQTWSWFLSRLIPALCVTASGPQRSSTPCRRTSSEDNTQTVTHIRIKLRWE